MKSIIVRSNEKFEAIKFMDQKEVFGFPVKKMNTIFEYSISFSNRRVGLNIGDWVLRSVNHNDMYNSDQYFMVPDEYLRKLYSETK